MAAHQQLGQLGIARFDRIDDTMVLDERSLRPGAFGLFSAMLFSPLLSSTLLCSALAQSDFANGKSLFCHLALAPAFPASLLD